MKVKDMMLQQNIQEQIAVDEEQLQAFRKKEAGERPKQS